jgi:cytochrome b pre-mRNA-processing protein 3
MILDTLFRKRRLDTPAGLIYGALVAQARDPWFYGELGVPDTVEGRFEMIALHGFIVLNRLKLEKRDGSPLAEQLGQAIFDLMFADMDRNLREMGVGDLGIAKRVKALIKGFYGRIKAYEEGLSGVDGLCRGGREWGGAGAGELLTGFRCSSGGSASGGDDGRALGLRAPLCGGWWTR